MYNENSHYKYWIVTIAKGIFTRFMSDLKLIALLTSPTFEFINSVG